MFGTCTVLVCGVQAQMSEIFRDSSNREIGPETASQIALAEYRALYDLLRLRLNAMDRRVPFAAGTLGAALAGIPSMPPMPSVVMLILLPASLAWLVATATGHARSKEDHLRRIAEIELAVNELAGRELLAFQSRHPSQGRFVSGRSGRISVLATATGALAALGCCGAFYEATQPPPVSLLAYFVYLVLIAAGVAYSLIRLRRYRYRKAPAPVRLVLPQDSRTST